MKTEEPGIIEQCIECGRNFEMGFPLYPCFEEGGQLCPECLKKYHPEWNDVLNDTDKIPHGCVMRNSEDPVTYKRKEKNKGNEFEEAIYDAIRNLKELALELESEPGCTGESFKQKLYELSEWVDTAWSLIVGRMDSLKISRDSQIRHQSIVFGWLE
jgi:hypothetical protein